MARSALATFPALLILTQCVHTTIASVSSFEKIDTDNSKTLSFHEWSASFLELHAPEPGEFQQLDTNNDGIATLEEYVAFKIGSSPSFAPASHEPNFGVIDKNIDHRVNEEEYIEPVQIYREAPAAYLERWDLLDADGDGTVTYNEFVTRIDLDPADANPEPARDAGPRNGNPYAELHTFTYSQYLQRHRESPKCKFDAPALSRVDCATLERDLGRLVDDINAASSEDELRPAQQALAEYGFGLLQNVFVDDLNSLDKVQKEVALFELLLFLHRRGDAVGGPVCGGVRSARSAAIALAGGFQGQESAVMLNLSAPSILSPYSILSDILVYNPLDLQLFRAALLAHAPAAPILYHGSHQEGVSLLHLAARTTRGEMPGIMTQVARYFYDARKNQQVKASYLADVGYERNLADVAGELLPNFVEFAPSFTEIQSWLQSEVDKALAGGEGTQFLFSADPTRGGRKGSGDLRNQYNIFDLADGNAALLSNHMVSSKDYLKFPGSKGLHRTMLAVAHEMSAAAMSLLFELVPDFDHRQLQVITQRFGIGAYHFMALEGCRECFEVITHRLLTASHEQVVPLFTNFQRQLLAHSQAISTETTIAKRSPFTFATAYWSLHGSSALIDTLLQSILKKTYLNRFANDSKLQDLYNASTIYPDYALAKNQPADSDVIAILDNSMADSYSKFWTGYMWPSQEWKIEGCSISRRRLPNVMQLTHCQGGVTIRAMREIFSQAMAPVVVPNIGANFVKAPPAIEFADKFASPKQSWRSLADFEETYRTTNGLSIEAGRLSFLREMLADMRNLFMFPGVGVQPGSSFTLPPVEQWRLFVAAKRMTWPGMKATEFQTDHRMQYIAPVTRGMRAYFLLRGKLKWNCRHSLAERDADDDQFFRNVRENQFEMAARSGQVLLIPAHWEASFAASADAILVEAVGLHFEEHDPFHSMHWPDPFIEFNASELVSPMVQPGGPYENGGRTFVADTPLPPIKGGNFVNMSYPGVTVARSSPNVYIIDDFLTQQEIRYLIQIAQPELRPSRTARKTLFDVHRTSYSLSTEAHHKVDWLVAKAEKVTGVPRSNYESPQIARYLGGQYYRVHDDAFATRSAQGRSQVEYGGQRCATLLMYLNDVEDGGTTHYPALDHLRVKPKAGRAVIFHPVLRDHEPDPRMGHESEPTGVNATKYVSQLWIRCLPVPVHTTEGGFTGSYMSLVEKQRQKDPDHIDEMLAYDPKVDPLPQPWDEELLHLGSRAAQANARERKTPKAVSKRSQPSSLQNNDSPNPASYKTFTREL